MKRTFAIALGLAIAVTPFLASAQTAPSDVISKQKGPPRAVLGTLIFISMRLSHDETWVYEPATGTVRGCCRGTHFPEATLKTQRAMPVVSNAPPIPQESVSPIKGIGVVIKKNGPPYPSSRVALPAIGPVPQEGVSPIKGVGVVIKRNPGSNSERAMPTAGDGSATFDGPLAPGTYDVAVALPADAAAGMAAPVSLTLQVIVAADGTATSAFASRKGYQYYKAQSDMGAY